MTDTRHHRSHLAAELAPRSLFRQTPLHTGTTLIELVAVIGIQSVLLGIIVTLIGALLQAERNGREQVQLGRSLDALAEQFRRDVHAASYAQGDVADPTSGFQMQLPDDEFIVYDVKQDSLERVAVVPKLAVSREVFRLPPNSTVRVSQEDFRGATLVCLQVVAEPSTATTHSRYWRCDAVLDRNRVMASVSDSEQ